MQDILRWRGYSLSKYEYKAQVGESIRYKLKQLIKYVSHAAVDMKIGTFVQRRR